MNRYAVNPWRILEITTDMLDLSGIVMVKGVDVSVIQPVTDGKILDESRI